MITSRTDFRDRVLAPLKTVADGLSLYQIFDDTSKAVPSDQSTKWVRIQVKHASGERASLGRMDGKTKETQGGLIFIEIYTPRNDGLQSSDTLSAAFADALRKFSDKEIWIRNVVGTEIGEDGSWFRSDVQAEFQYDLIR
jgi:hypothetical protein